MLLCRFVLDINKGSQTGEEVCTNGCKIVKLSYFLKIRILFNEYLYYSFFKFLDKVGKIFLDVVFMLITKVKCIRQRGCAPEILIGLHLLFRVLMVTCILGLSPLAVGVPLAAIHCGFPGYKGWGRGGRVERREVYLSEFQGLRVPWWPVG